MPAEVSADVDSWVDNDLRRAFALQQQSQFAEAASLYEQVLRFQPQHFGALHMLGLLALQTGRPQRAVELISRALAAPPAEAAEAAACCNLGNALSALGRFAEALGCYDRAAALCPQLPEIHNNRGNVLRELGRHEAAIASYSAALALRPDYPEAYNNRGLVLADARRHEAAIEDFRRALVHHPGNADTYNNLANAQRALKRHSAALASYEIALSFRPDHADLQVNRAIVLAELKRYEAAIAGYDRAIELAPQLAEAHANRGNLLRDLKQYEAAVASYDRAVALQSDLGHLYGARLHTKMQVCDWRNLDAESSELAARIERRQPASNPFCVLPLSDSTALHRQAAEVFVHDLHPPNGALGPIAPRPGRERIRLGYFSADYHNHPTMYLMAGLFEAHDRGRFEVTAFSFGVDAQDEMRGRLRAACERFVDVRQESDLQVAALARRLEIDIAIDLKGFTNGRRTEIFALRAAPLQVSYLGYPGTMAAPYIDYLIADRTVMAAPARRAYSEKVLYLPGSYQINDAKRVVAGLAMTRAEAALPSTGFVFCCFNNSYKINPEMLERWVRILRRVEGSVLWLLEDSAAATRNLRREAELRGLHPERLVFASRIAHAQHLARQRLADLFLDTLPYNAHTTASDALWVGLPVLTCLGEAFAGRVAASLLQAVGLPELISSSMAEYEELAVALATDPARLTDIRRRLVSHRSSASLFDTTRTTRHIEAAYAHIYQRHRKGLAPEDMDIPCLDRDVACPRGGPPA